MVEMTTKTKQQDTIEILVDGKWTEVSRQDQATDFARWMDLRDWEMELFSNWYAKHPEHWTPVNRVQPMSGVGEAFNAWLRRP
jgi:hypothetical protein